MFTDIKWKKMISLMKEQFLEKLSYFIDFQTEACYDLNGYNQKSKSL